MFPPIDATCFWAVAGFLTFLLRCNRTFSFLFFSRRAVAANERFWKTAQDDQGHEDELRSFRHFYDLKELKIINFHPALLSSENSMDGCVCVMLCFSQSQRYYQQLEMLSWMTVLFSFGLIFLILKSILLPIAARSKKMCTPLKNLLRKKGQTEWKNLFWGWRKRHVPNHRPCT